MAIDDFSVFAKMVADRFQGLCTGQVFVADLGDVDLFFEYLDAFPEGTNPTFKKRSEHDCSCCKHFVRRAGGVVGIADSGALQTVWDVAADRAPEPYRTVAERLRDLLRDAAINDLYRVGDKEGSFGSPSTRVLDKETQKVVTWHHLHTGEIPRHLRAALPDTARGDYRTTVQVFERGLVELSPDAVETVLALVEANNLYRGAEHKVSLIQFQNMQRAFLALPEGKARSTFAWCNAEQPASRFRNTVIGTLVQDISEGQDVEQAVKSFETKVAPQNYKRTTAVITPGMVKKAMETIDSLGLESALERRFATIADVSVNDVKWVDGSVRPMMKGGIGEVLMAHAESSRPAEVDESRAEQVDLDDFVARVLPETTSLEILFKGEHVGNLVSLTAPVHPEPKQLFRWHNDFAWSYGGNVADSIKERVKKAGGKVEGAVLRISLSWFNFDDLDLHVLENVDRGSRSAGGHIFFRAKLGITGGRLDVDMNAGHGTSREAVENVTWSTKPPDGTYGVVVNNYARRETSDPGFVVEVESAGKLSHYSYNKGIQTGQDVNVVFLHVKNGVVADYQIGDPAITASNAYASQDKWGLRTEQFVKVASVMLSPNHWGGQSIGNKHTFFVVQGCKNDEATRGFYNEFLHPRLEPHRKVFEVIADKTKCRPTDGQLSGLGFSSTKKESFVVRAKQGSKQRLFNVRVGS